MTSSAELADRAWRRGLMPAPVMSVAEWADAKRVLPSISAEPGPWRTRRTPYLRAIMDALSPESGIETVIVMAGSQVGKTECGLNWLGFIIDYAPGLTLMVQPSIDMVKKNVRTRLDPMIEASPVLSELIGPARAKDAANSMFLKEFPGGQLVMAGANSGAALRSLPARYLFLDEIDAYPGDVDGEGDPVDIAIRRTATFRGRRKVYLVSTPTVKGESRIEAAYAGSDQRKFFVPCLHCGDMAPITWARIQWPKGKRAEAYCACESCGGIAEEHDKGRMLAAGEWRPGAPGDGRTAGFHLSALYSPFESWATIAIAHGQVKADPARLQVWTNTALAECWEDVAGESLKSEILFARREPFGEALPDGVAALTAGVDVQDDRLECQVVGWGAGEESWVITNEVFPGDPSGRPVWDELDAFLQRPFPRSGLPAVAIRAACIDTGGHNTRAVYDYCRTRHSRRVWAIKGSSTPTAPAWPRRPSYTNTGKVPLYVIGVDTLKDTVAARLASTEAGPGTIHFPAHLPPHYFEQFASERRITRYERGRPKRSWQPRSGARNEAFDTFIYAFAALTGLQALGLRLDEEARLLTAPDAEDMPATPRRVKSRWMDR